MMPAFGDIVLTRFRFTDLTGEKLRPALVISSDAAIGEDMILAFITSRIREQPVHLDFPVRVIKLTS